MIRPLPIAALLLLPVLAHAQPVSGLYIGAGGGANFKPNEFLKFQNFGSSTAHSNGRTKFDTGETGFASLGYGFGNGFRVELEGFYLNNQVSLVSPSRSQHSYGGMFNGLFDFDIGSPYVFPYAGAGVGYASTNRYYSVFRLSNSAVNTFRFDEGGFAYQGIVGAAFPIPFVTGLSATLDYRFMGLADSKRTFQLDAGFDNGRSQQKIRNAFDNIVSVGLRYAFDVAPPPAPAAPVPAVVQPGAARTYLVFFDWDRADLTARARQIVADAAANFEKVQYTRIDVNGNADKSGTPAYNVGLSQRRAENVAGELVRLGVSRGAIDIHAYGDTRPLVPTGPGVREPQNRRVEIVIH